MADSRFFVRAGPYSLAALAGLSGAALRDEGDGARVVYDVAPLETAGPNDVAFLDNRKYVAAFARSGAGAAFVSPELAGRAPPGMALLLTAEPYKAFALAAQAFYPEPPVVPGRAPTAVVDSTAVVPGDCEIGAHVVIGAGSRLGARCRIGPNTGIGVGVEIGEDCRIAANVTLSHCRLGARVVLHPGVRIGQPGFGFAPDPVRPVKVPQLGLVIIGDDVDIGANAAIDRGSNHDTVIGSGTMIDNLVHIAHNVQIGRCCALAGQIGIAGSSVLGNYIMIGGQAGIAGHLRIDDGVRIAAQAGVLHDVPAGQSVGGTPAVLLRMWARQVAVLRRLAKKKGE